eukprot:346121-Prymnesium_polylepis.1
MIPQHSPTTQGSAHLPEARAPLVPPSHRPPPRCGDAKCAVCAHRAHRMVLLGWGSPSRRAPTRTARAPSRTACVPT